MFRISSAISTYISAILFVDFTFGIYHVSMFRNYYFPGDPVCKMIMFIPLVTISSSISTMVAIALDRFREIVQTHKLSQKKAIHVISGIWIWSITISAPQLYEYSVYVKYEKEYNITSCGSHDIVEHFETIYATIIIILLYAIPLIIIAICYSRTMMFVWKAGKTIAGMESQIFQKRVKIVKVLILITVVFAVLWSPYFILFGIEVSRYLFWKYLFQLRENIIQWVIPRHIQF